MFGTCDDCGATCVQVFLVNRDDETGKCAECLYVATRVGILR